MQAKQLKFTGTLVSHWEFWVALRMGALLKAQQQHSCTTAAALPMAHFQLRGTKLTKVFRLRTLGSSGSGGRQPLHTPPCTSGSTAATPTSHNVNSLSGPVLQILKFMKHAFAHTAFAHVAALHKWHLHIWPLCICGRRTLGNFTILTSH